MQAKKRYILVFLSCAFLAYCYFGGYRLKRGTTTNGILSRKKPITIPNEIPSFLSSLEYDAAFDMHPDVDDFNEFNDGGVRGSENAVLANDIVNDIVTATHQLLSDHFEQQHVESKVHAAHPAHPGAGGDGGPDSVDLSASNGARKGNSISVNNGGTIRPCRMETCFDYTKCYEANRQLLVYVYPADAVSPMGSSTPPTSLNYQKILSAITESRYYTTDPERACLFVLGIDTLDRDSLSEDYVRNVPSRLQRLPYWNNGRNHVIFNLYSGTWPDYAENSLGFDTGEAILAKASMSVRQIRPGFDISIPLFHKQHPLRAGNNGFVSSNNFPTNKKYLLAFKGKR